LPGPALLAAGQEKLLHSFCTVSGCPDGESPYFAGVVFDTDGNLYGTTTGGGVYGQGTVFELVPDAAGRWTERVLHSFQDDGQDGFYPMAGLVVDRSGNLYGATDLGGEHGGGTVFELTRRRGQKWTEKILHSFDDNGRDGYLPRAGLILDSNGNLYATTMAGGTYGGGDCL
jgi:uncharacterized repeat protein (TIGR03803 family)